MESANIPVSQAKNTATNMASTIASGLGKAQEALKGHAQGAKVEQLAAVTKDYNDPSYRITSDYGVKQENTDDWLTVASEDHTGPMLLEDAFGREKIHHSITRGSQNVSFTQEALVHLELLKFSNRHQM